MTEYITPLSSEQGPQVNLGQAAILPRDHRPHRMQKSARRQQLLDVASVEFVNRGYYQTGMDEIAIKAGISKPVLYQHFPGKLELYLAVLTQHIDSLLTMLRQALRSDNDEKKRVYATVRAFFEFVSQKTPSYRLIFQSDITEASVQQKITEAIDDCVNAVYDILRHDRHLDSRKAHIISVGLVGMSQTNARFWVESASSTTADISTEEAIVSMEEAINITASMAWGAYVFAYRDSL